MEELEITRETIKALSSDTRVEIIKALKERRKTVSELSSEMRLSKSTVHEHLEKLLRESLIQRNESYTNKWVYYELTRKGSELLETGEKKVLLLLSSIGVAVLGALSLSFSLLKAVPLGAQTKAFAVGREATAFPSVEAGEIAADKSAEAVAAARQSEPFFALGIILLIIALALFVLWIKKRSA